MLNGTKIRENKTNRKKDIILSWNVNIKKILNVDLKGTIINLIAITGIPQL